MSAIAALATFDYYLASTGHSKYGHTTKFGRTGDATGDALQMVGPQPNTKALDVHGENMLIQRETSVYHNPNASGPTLAKVKEVWGMSLRQAR